MLEKYGFIQYVFIQKSEIRSNTIRRTSLFSVFVQHSFGDAKLTQPASHATRTHIAHPKRELGIPREHTNTEQKEKKNVQSKVQTAFSNFMYLSS